MDPSSGGGGKQPKASSGALLAFFTAMLLHCTIPVCLEESTFGEKPQRIRVKNNCHGIGVCPTRVPWTF